MQFVQISQPGQVIATSSSNVNKVQTRSVAKGVKKGTVRGPDIAFNKLYSIKFFLIFLKLYFNGI